jgi:sec-independent protein translocase protein TatC
MTTLKIAFYAGIVISFPALLWFLAGFVLPALTRQEKKLLFPGIIGGTVLFVGGVVGSYVFILPKAMAFFQKWNEDHGFHLKEVLLGKYFSMVVNLMLACGLLCEGPVVILVLAKLGLVSYHLLSRTRSYAVVVLLIIIALIAPSPDPFTFMTLAIPALGVYELCIWLVWLMERRRDKEGALRH